MGDPNYAALLFQQQADGSTRQIGAASGGWEQQADGRSQLQQDSPVLPWLENTVQGGQRRRVLPPNSAAATASNPFLDVCSAFLAKRKLGQSIMPKWIQRIFDRHDYGRFPSRWSVDNISPHNEIQARDEVPAAVKGNTRRSKNFTLKEDEMLVSAWLNVSLDPVRGANQSKDTYWKRIHDYFHSKKDFESHRTQSSLMSRWSSILHDCNIFAGCVSKVEARNQSGASVDDKQANALTMRQPTGPQKPLSKKQKTTADSTPAIDAPDPVTGTVAETETTITTVPRPTGTKKEKLKLKQRSSIEALDYLLAKKKEVDAEKELKKKERELKKEERELKKQEMCQKNPCLAGRKDKT
ncbi:unnamed protein product [Miscanthus lutarioriparius]|uniref:No apical meristem-associated C-terminal domain-containing protein n=1 Tax=Miscanthus lutarioriparius TaxID=422564 RepID=A0A811Q202_9POAL|nr:unnamed protein product [Miscanthus lutarioriparius]